MTAALIPALLHTIVELPLKTWWPSQYKVTSIGIPMSKIRRSRDRLIFSIEIPIPRKDGLCTETGHSIHCFRFGSIIVTSIRGGRRYICVDNDISVHIFQRRRDAVVTLSAQVKPDIIYIYIYMYIYIISSVDSDPSSALGYFFWRIRKWMSGMNAIFEKDQRIINDNQCLSLGWHFTIGVPRKFMMTSSNGNTFRVTDPLYGEFTGHRWIPLIKACEAAELWCFLWSVP